MYIPHGILNAVSRYDVFVHKMSQTEKVETKETHLAAKFTMYPNPTNGKFIIQLEQHLKCADVVLSNIMGQVIARQSVNGHDPVEIQVDGANGFCIVSGRSEISCQDIKKVMGTNAR